MVLMRQTAVSFSLFVRLFVFTQCPWAMYIQVRGFVIFHIVIKVKMIFFLKLFGIVPLTHE